MRVWMLPVAPGFTILLPTFILIWIHTNLVPCRYFRTKFKMALVVSGVEDFETFTVACGSERPMLLVRCDNGQCRAA